MDLETARADRGAAISLERNVQFRRGGSVILDQPPEHARIRDESVVHRLQAGDGVET